MQSVKINVFLFACLICCSINGFAQNVQLGTWQTYLPYTVTVSVTQSTKDAIFATETAVFFRDKQDGSTRFLTKVNGLNDVGISRVKYHQEREMLMVAYENSNIDIVYGDRVYNFGEIKRASILGDKRINNIYFDGNTAYLSCGFGLVAMNLERDEIRYTTFTNSAVYAFEKFQGKNFMSTANGIYEIDPANPFPEDFGSWNKIGTAEGLPSSYAGKILATHNNKLYASVYDSIYVWNGSSAWSFLFSENNFSPQDLQSGQTDLILTMREETGLPGKVELLKEDGTLSSGQGSNNPSCLSRVNEALEDQYGQIWISDLFTGAAVYNHAANTCTVVQINGPYSDLVKELAFKDGNLWLASGAVNEFWQYQYIRDGFSKLSDGSWATFREGNRSELFEVWDIITATPHPSNNKVYFGSYIRGLVEYDPPNITIYGEGTSSLGGALGDPDNYRVSGTAFDKNENLWVSNFGAAKPLSVFLADGTWQNFSINTSSKNLNQIAVDPFTDHIWISLDNAGILVYDHNGTPGNPMDDKQLVLNKTNTVLPSNKINCLEFDLSGHVWVGTPIGTVVFQCASLIFEPSGCSGTKKIVNEEGEDDAYLLETENILTIAVDGGNRKWFGSENGIFVQSESGLDNVHRFTVDNSPLLSNRIVDIAMDQESGDVYIGTDKGLLSYRGEAVAGGVVHSGVYAYPNPVREGYNGPIAVKGLVQDANVKITDIHGQLVFEGESAGGQFVWDGADYNGRKSASGVYMVFSSDQTGQESFVTKILIIR